MIIKQHPNTPRHWTLHGIVTELQMSGAVVLTQGLDPGVASIPVAWMVCSSHSWTCAVSMMLTLLIPQLVQAHTPALMIMV